MFTALNRLSSVLEHFSDSVNITGISVAMTGISLVKGKAKQHLDWPDVVYTKDNTVSTMLHHPESHLTSHEVTAGVYAMLCAHQ